MPSPSPLPLPSPQTARHESDRLARAAAETEKHGSLLLRHDTPERPGAQSQNNASPLRASSSSHAAPGAGVLPPPTPSTREWVEAVEEGTATAHREAAAAAARADAAEAALATLTTQHQSLDKDYRALQSNAGTAWQIWLATSSTHMSNPDPLSLMSSFHEPRRNCLALVATSSTHPSNPGPLSLMSSFDEARCTSNRLALIEGASTQRAASVMGEMRWRQGLTLVHLSAQRKRFLWDRGCLAGV